MVVGGYRQISRFGSGPSGRLSPSFSTSWIFLVITYAKALNIRSAVEYLVKYSMRSK
ncbi:hypothetical protein TMatcc_010042 [Talaromyces marneffei ATCC 18224]